MTGSAWIAALAAGSFTACSALADSAAPNRGVAGMYAEASRLAVGAEEAEGALLSVAALQLRPDVMAGIERIVGTLAGIAVGASSTPTKASLTR